MKIEALPDSGYAHYYKVEDPERGTVTVRLSKLYPVWLCLSCHIETVPDDLLKAGCEHINACKQFIK